MTQPSLSSYPDWKAPSEDAQTLLWPEPAELLRDTRENQRRLSTSDSVLIQNIPYPEIRRKQRAWIGHDDSRPLLANGHQTELYHAGVWAKNVLVSTAARKLGGDAYHFAVDTDEPKHLVLRWPGGAEPLTDDPAQTSAAWSGLVKAPTAQHLTKLRDAVSAAERSWKFKPAIQPFFDSMQRASSTPKALPQTLTAAIHETEASLGLNHRALVVSPLWGSEPYLVFVHHLLAHADELAGNYNTSLADYRRAQNIKTPGRPMPDLKTEPDRCEVPFWIDSLSAGKRSRASVERSSNRWTLRLPDGDWFAFDPAREGWVGATGLANFLKSHDLRLAPRAIMMTTYLRLFLADQFVHGIGGGRYDQVTDLLIARHFKFEPPKFSVTTATMYFPDAVGRPRACLPCIEQEGHRLKHSILGESKMRMVETIELLPRKSARRREIFSQMHDALTAAVATHPAIQRWEKELRTAEERTREEQSLFDRELFFAIQPRERLMEMIAKYDRAFAGS